MDLRQVEVTIQNLIGSGMDPKTENNPYLGFIYTSFQVGCSISFLLVVLGRWGENVWWAWYLQPRLSGLVLNTAVLPLARRTGARHQGQPRQHRPHGWRVRRRRERG